MDTLLGGHSHVAFRDLPDMDEFLRAHKAAGLQFTKLLQTLGLEEPSRTQIAQKLRAILRKNDLPLAGESPEARGVRLFNAIGRAAEHDAQLRAFFELENRVALLSEAPRFLDEYLEWFAATHREDRVP